MTEDTNTTDITDPEYDPYVDAQRCIGCGLCPDMLDTVFALNHEKFGIAYVHDPDGWRPDDAAQLELTAKNCPVGAIGLHADRRDTSEPRRED